MDNSTRKLVGILLTLVGLVLLVAIVALVGMEVFVWAKPDAGPNWGAIGGGACCGLLSLALTAYGLLMAVMASRAS